MTFMLWIVGVAVVSYILIGFMPNPPPDLAKKGDARSDELLPMGAITYDLVEGEIPASELSALVLDILTDPKCDGYDGLDCDGIDTALNAAEELMFRHTAFPWGNRPYGTMKRVSDNYPDVAVFTVSGPLIEKFDRLQIERDPELEHWHGK